MKFQATVVLEFTVHGVAEAGEPDAALETRSLGTAVTLPPVVPTR